MKTINFKFFVLLILGIAITGFIQTIAMENSLDDLKWSNNIKSYPVFIQSSIIHVTDDYIYYFQGFGEIKAVGANEGFIKYDRKNGTVITSPIKLRTDKIARVRLFVCVNNDSIHVISYFNNRLQNAVYIFDETFNLNTLESNNDVHKISEIEYDKTNLTNSNDIYIKMRKNEYVANSIGLYYFYETKKEYIHGHQAFDYKFTLKAKYKRPTDKRTLTPNYVFDKEDNLYTIERYNESGTSIDYKSSKVRLAFSPKDGSSPIIRNIELENNFIVEQTLSVNNRNQVVCAGLFSNKGTQSAIGGFSIITSPQLTNKDIITKINFDISLIIEGKSKKESKDIEKNIALGKNFDGDYSYTIHDIHFRKDGSYTMLVDKNAKAYSGKGNYDYYYGDIYILSFDSLGKSQWTQKIFRKQVIGESGFNEHILGGYIIDYGKNDDITVIYNIVNSENIFSAGDKINNTMIYRIDNNGNKSCEVLISDQKVTKTFCPEISFNCGDGRYIVTKFNYISNMLKNTFNFGELTIK